MILFLISPVILGQSGWQFNYKSLRIWCCLGPVVSGSRDYPDLSDSARTSRVRCVEDHVVLEVKPWMVRGYFLAPLTFFKTKTKKWITPDSHMLTEHITDLHLNISFYLNQGIGFIILLSIFFIFHHSSTTPITIMFAFLHQDLKDFYHLSTHPHPWHTTVVGKPIGCFQFLWVG